MNRNFSVTHLLLAVASIVSDQIFPSQGRFRLRKIEAETSIIPGSGMDKPSISFFGLSNGGTYSMSITSGSRQCRTKILNTEDNNWEEGQVDWFVGRQIGRCNGFMLKDGSVQLTIHHEGSNSGTLNYVKLHTWHTAGYWHCPINKRLDYSDSYTADCEYVENHPISEAKTWCNGRPEFCELNFKQYLFLGAHNAGTGQSEGYWRCVSKNQDLNITEQLDFGVRFFDLDTIYSFSASNCDGLETGHGMAPNVGIYQCYGKVDTMLVEFKKWMNLHPTEIAVLYFGGIASKEETVPRLVEALHKHFPAEENSTSVRLNTAFKTTGEWPTLGEAVQTNERVFAFIRHESIDIADKGIVREIRLKLDADSDEELTVDAINDQNSVATILSSYKSSKIDGDCDFVIETSEDACERQDVDFVKLSLFSRFGKGGTLGTDCIWHMARYCNQWVGETIQICKKYSSDDDALFKPNMILLDYPNYQAKGAVEIVEKENLRRASIVKGQDD